MITTYNYKYLNDIGTFVRRYLINRNREYKFQRVLTYFIYYDFSVPIYQSRTFVFTYINLVYCIAETHVINITIDVL